MSRLVSYRVHSLSQLICSRAKLCTSSNVPEIPHVCPQRMKVYPRACIKQQVTRRRRDPPKVIRAVNIPELRNVVYRAADKPLYYAILIVAERWSCLVDSYGLLSLQASDFYFFLDRPQLVRCNPRVRESSAALQPPLRWGFLISEWGTLRPF
ncbi:hypothetical protein TNCV_998501 [Trichonephila clavipes]|nr:hypothetical protein TNCV_998501 [Trichonephila clavipes]